MTLSELKQKQVNLSLQRANLKSAVEQIEQTLGQIAFAIQVLEQQPTEAPEPNAE